jgi:prevent-host-death family protein
MSKSAARPKTRAPRRYSIAEARSSLPALVHDAEKGGPIELTRRGQAVAVILSVLEYQKLIGPRGPGLLDRLQRFRAAHDLEALDPGAAFADVSDRSPGRDVKL